jgi:hypothetical protein
MFVINKVLFESFLQLSLQSAFFYQSLVEDNTLSYTVVSIFFSMISISVNCMLFLRLIAQKKMKIDIAENAFFVTRSISNIFLVVSRVIPFSLIFTTNYFFSLCLYVTIRFIAHTIYNIKFEIFDFRLEDNKPDNMKKLSQAVIFSIIKSIAFFEEFELTKSYILYHLIVLIENITMIFLFCFFSSISFYSETVIGVLFLIVACFLIGILIEILHWKFIVDKKPFQTKKFNITDISEHVNLNVTSFLK